MKIELKIICRDDNGISQPLALQPGGSGLEAFVHVLEEAANTFWQKDQLYGGAWRSQGWMGNLARIQSKTARLKNMLWRDDALEDSEEPVQDTVKDLINLCVFALLNRGQRNKWGGGSSE